MAKTPPCPGNPDDYILVKSKEGYFWRRKRGTVTEAKLNSAMQANADATKIVSPATKRIIDALKPFMSNITPGRLNTRIGKALRKSLRETKELQLAYLKGIEFQANHPLNEMLVLPYTVKVDKKLVRIETPIEKNTIKPANRLVSDYFFDAILVYGDVNKDHKLEIDSEESQLYPVGGKGKTTCVIELPLPKKEDWMLVLKLNSLEGTEYAAHTKHYRMKVVAVRDPKTKI